MKKNIFLIIAIMMMMISVSNGGSKMVEPVDAPVEPIPVMSEPVPVYLGLGLLWGRYSHCTHNCNYEDVTLGALVRAGYEWNEYLGIEARILASFFEKDPQGGQSLRHLGLFAKPMYPLTDDFTIYGLIGYGWTKTITGGNHRLTTVDEGGLSGGLGLEYDLFDNEDDRDQDTMYDRGFDGYADQEKGWGLFVDYQRLLIKSNAPDMDIVSGGVTYDF